MIARKKQWPLAVGASFEIVLAVVIGIVIVGAFRGWFTSFATSPDRPADIHALVGGAAEAQSARLPDATAARQTQR